MSMVDPLQWELLKKKFVNKIKNKRERFFDLHQMNIKLYKVSLIYDIFQYTTKNHYQYFTHFLNLIYQ